MRTVSSLAVMALVLTLAGSVRAEEKSQTLTGEIACAKCVYKVAGITECTNAIKVKDGDKEVVYLIDDDGKKSDYHKKICMAAGKGSVTGVVSKTGDQMHIKPDAHGVKVD